MRRVTGLYYIVCILGLLAPGPAYLHAQVNQGELEQGQAPVTFLNYEGPHARVETRAQIRNIGYGLGQAVKAGNGRPGTPDRYFVIHSASEADGTRLDADIFGLGFDTGVDHINNLRLIIQGYLEGAYDYSEGDAALIAQYVTVYNAVYRGNWNYFSTRYKTPVVQNLAPEKTGLSIRYDEWPGRTLMVIPLGSGIPGSLSAVDTTSLGDGRVVEELRKDDDRGVDQRQDLVDLKEREADEAEQRAAEQREAIAGEEQRIAEERADAAAERDRIEQERQQNQEDAAAGSITAEEAQQKEDELAAEEAAVDAKEDKLAAQEEALDERREEARRDEEFAEQKNAEAQEERANIARDQQELIGEEQNPQSAAAAAPQGLLGGTIEGQDNFLGRVVRIVPATGQELARSPLNTVNSRTLSVVDGKLIAVAGEARGNGAIRLIELDRNTLEMVYQGDDDIHPNSLLWINGSDIYAITLYNGGLYLARFNSQLARSARSTIAVHPYASAFFQDGMVFTQRADGSALILNAGDLTEVR
jgi:multidrug efflux pump subunit AcrA (membrane-fusion protein)